MNDLFERAVGYFVLEHDIPDFGLIAGDRVYFGNDPQTAACLVVVAWDDEVHLCCRTDSGTLTEGYTGAAVPADAVVIGGALGVFRAFPGYFRKEAKQ